MNQTIPVATRNDTICAVATPPGSGAIAIVRLSGPGSLDIAFKIFRPFQENLKKETIKSHHMYYGQIRSKDELVDEVLFTYFKAPHSYTGEDSVEISCHGSEFIQQKLIELLLQNGARFAEPGEYTMRAFLNGKLDLSQAEAVADLIASQSRSAHKMAMNQMRGGFSEKIRELRGKLVQFTSLIELELDFSEEDVEFADRGQLKQLVQKIDRHLKTLIDSFTLGNVIKNGIPVAIIGEPNVGKSTLLNALLNEDKAIVSDIPGTTRDAIEDVVNLNGVLFRFIDTAGIRETTDTIESLGIERTFSKIENAEIVLLMVDASDNNIKKSISEIKDKIGDKKLLIIINKIDLAEKTNLEAIKSLYETVEIAARHKKNIKELIKKLRAIAGLGTIDLGDTIITNTRHYEALSKAWEAIQRVNNGMENKIPSDFLAMDIREVLHYLGEISGEITNDEILGNIFKNFCIGK